MDFISGVFAGVVASWLFWPIMIALLLGLVYATEKLAGFGAVLSAGLVGLLIYHKWPDTYAVLADNWILTAVGFIAIAIVWSMFKFSVLVRTKLKAFQTFRDRFLGNKGLPSDYFSPANRAKADPSIEADFVTSIVEHYGTRNLGLTGKNTTLDRAIAGVVPRAADNKKALFMWAVYWPFSMISFVIRDAVTALGEAIYAKLGGTYQRIANKIFSNAL